MPAIKGSTSAPAQRRSVAAPENAPGRIQEVLILLRRVIRATDLHSKHLAKTTGLTAPQILLLQSVKKSSDVSIGRLASDMNLSQATVTTILDRLERRSLVYRKRSSEDKRRVHVHLTDLGRETLEKAPMPLQAQFTSQFEALQEWEQTMIVSALGRVAQMMDAQNLDVIPVLDMDLLESHGDLQVEEPVATAADRK